MIPLQAMQQRGYSYDDPLVADRVKKEDAPDSSPLSPKAINEYIKRLNAQIEYVFDFSIECLPITEQKRYRVVGRIFNQLGEREDVVAGLANSVTSDGRQASAFEDVDRLGPELYAAVQRLFLRLAQIPEIEPDHQRDLYDLGEEVHRFFILRRNDGTEDDSNFQTTRLDNYRIEQTVVEITGDVAAEICRKPAERWPLVTCTGRFAAPSERCAPAGKVPFRVQKLFAFSSVPTRNEGGGQEALGAHIDFRGARYEADYLIRAVAVASEESPTGPARIESVPSYHCVHVRARKYFVGIGGRVATKETIIDLDAKGETSSHPPALVYAVGGVDLELPRLVSTGAWQVSRIGVMWLVPVLGFSNTQGAYPRAWSDPKTPELRPASALPRYSASYTDEARGKLRWDPIGAGLWSLWGGTSIELDVGFGAEWLRSENRPFRNDGLHGVFLLGLAAPIYLQWYWRSANVAMAIHVGPYLQFRWRMDQATLLGALGSPIVDAPGVPDSLFSAGYMGAITLSPPGALQR